MKRGKKAEQLAWKKAWQKQTRKNKAQPAPHSVPGPVAAAPAAASPVAGSPAKAQIVSSAPRRWSKVKLGVIVALAGVIVTAGVGYYQYKVARDSSERGAGRVDTRTEVVGVVPDVADVKHLMVPSPVFLNKDDDKKPAEVVLFENMHSLYKVNPGVVIKNTGTEVVEQLRIQLEEASVIDMHPVPYMLWSEADKKVKPASWVMHRPTLDLVQSEVHVLTEKFKPGHEAVVPIWRPLLKAMQKAQVNKEGWKGRYWAGFVITAYAKGSGMTAPDKSDKIATLGFAWNAENFTDEVYKKHVDEKREVIVKIRRASQQRQPANVVAAVAAR